MEQLGNIVKNDKDIRIEILNNIVRMCNNRGLIEEKNMKNIVDNFVKKDKTSNEHVFNFKTKNNKNVSIKFIGGKLTTIRRISNIDEFFVKNKNNKKIIVVKDMNQKAYKQFMEYKDTEVFWERELLINIVEHDIVPEHILLDEEQKEEYLKSYNIKKNEMSRIYVTDPISRYYNAKIGDIFKIIRMSISSGYAIHYRLVVNHSLFN